MIRSYFSLFRKIGLMYTEVSKENIFPGLQLCDELSELAKAGDAQEEMNRKNKELTAFMNKSVENVKAKVSKVGHAPQMSTSLDCC